MSEHNTYTGFSVKIKNYKCFADDPQGFNEIKPINVIIGKNNSGKSSLIDLIQSVTEGKFEYRQSLWRNGKIPQIVKSDVISEEEISKVFGSGTSGGPIHGNHYEFGKQWIGKSLTWTVDAKNVSDFHTDPQFGIADSEERYRHIIRQKPLKIRNKIFRRISAERDITPEPTSSTISVGNNGAGATNTIRNYVLKADLPSAIIEVDLLEKLNRIYGPDFEFDDINTREISDNLWEVHLREKSKERLPLSQYGSGFKTVLLALLNITTVPHQLKLDLSSLALAIEEPENNLHPALFRKFLLYLRERVENDGLTLFITTHSSVAIDVFSTDPLSQIIHVSHDGDSSIARNVFSYQDSRGILEDLDVRASDVLQSNGIIWVEGPSDRTYINHWISVWSDGKLREGAHYQCVFYGGKLLSHLSLEPPDQATATLINLLRINRNAIVLIDSDRSTATDPINATKQRIIQEISDIGGMAWVTAGRDIENYVSPDSISALYGSPKIQIGQFDEFSDFLEKHKTGEAKNFLKAKSVYADRITHQITTKSHITGNFDLADRIDEVCQRISAWNRL